LAQIRPDVVEAPDFHGAGLVVALRTRLQRRAPAVVTRLHTPSFLTARLAQERPDLDLRAAEVLEAASVHSARSVTSPSEALARAVRRRWRVPAGRVHVMPNPIDEDLFAPESEDVEIPGRILVVGRVERNKGQDLLVEALPAIRRSVPHAHLSVLGADGGMAEQLTRRARVLRVSDAVRFEGPRAREELPTAYRSASVCVVPSRFDAFPYSCIEAMACGRAVVAARVGGLPEAIADQTDGLLVAPENPAALANAVTRLLLDAAQRRRLGHAARARVTSCFATTPVATRMAEHYAELMP
jgi:glycogen synthase